MEKWVHAHASNTKPGDVVRVIDGSFSKNLGEMHNGRICEVTEVRGGDFIVRSIDGRDPELKRTFYSPNILEKRVEE